MSGWLVILIYPIPKGRFKGKNTCGYDVFCTNIYSRIVIYVLLFIIRCFSKYELNRVLELEALNISCLAGSIDSIFCFFIFLIWDIMIICSIRINKYKWYDITLHYMKYGLTKVYKIVHDTLKLTPLLLTLSIICSMQYIVKKYKCGNFSLVYMYPEIGNIFYFIYKILTKFNSI